MPTSEPIPPCAPVGHAVSLIPLQIRLFPLDAFKYLGFAVVDIFILLSAMGLYVSLNKEKTPSHLLFYLRRGQRILPTFWLIVGLYSLYLVICGRIN